MASAPVEIPNRALFRAPEVCDLAQVQPYVLRTWEAEFPDLGVSRTPGGPRVYRRADVERVLEIKQLLFVEGLTMAGVRRRLEEPGTRTPRDEEALADLVGADVRDRLLRVKRGLQELLDLLSRGSDGPDARAAAPANLFEVIGPTPPAPPESAVAERHPAHRTPGPRGSPGKPGDGARKAKTGSQRSRAGSAARR